jgi:hypothetical protein
VATYPPVGDVERDAALSRIERRHLRAEDPRWSEAGTEARDVLDYLRARRGQLPSLVTDEDAYDELVLSAWVFWDERRHERELLHHALRRGLSLSQVGRYLGITSRQGMRDYLDRLDALLDDYTSIRKTLRSPARGDGATDPLEIWAHTTRAHRGADVHAARAKRTRARVKPDRENWIATHETRITAAIRDLLAQASRLGLTPRASETGQDPDIGDYLHWLTEDLDALDFDGGTFGALGLVIGELRSHPYVADRSRNHGIHQVMATINQLRADFGELRADSGSVPAKPQ